MMADETAGAISDTGMGCKMALPNVRRQQVRIVKVSQLKFVGRPRLAFKAFERLEPCAGKLASTVLRGLRHEVAFESVMTGR